MCVILDALVLLIFIYLFIFYYYHFFFFWSKRLTGHKMSKMSLEICSMASSFLFRNEKCTIRVVNIHKNTEMWNTVFREHQRQSPLCDGYLSWDSTAEQQWGWAWREKAVCSSCPYSSGMFDLFDVDERSERGRKMAKINMGLQIGLSHTPISTSSFQKLCLSCNIPCPSSSGMQYTSNKISKKIEEAAEEDMRQQRQLLKTVNVLRGNEPSLINVQADCVYNNALYSGVGKTPFRPATQCAYTIAENNTFKHQIISAVAKNKLCSNIREHEEHKLNAKVGAPPGNCSSNLEMEQDIGNEEAWAKESLLSLKHDGLDVKEITTDPDSSAHRAAESLYRAGITKTEPEHSLDTRHVSENHRKFIKNLKPLKDIMPARLQRDKEKLKDRFANDFSKRCQAEYEQAFEASEDFTSMKRNLSYSSDAVVDCYFGQHDNCKKYSYTCSNYKNAKTWLEKSAFLKNDFKINETSEAKKLLRHCVQYRLGPSMLHKTPKNANTQKVEGANRAIRTTVAKNVTYRRNYGSRVHTAVHNVNHGPGESIGRFCNALGCPIIPGTNVAKGLKYIQHKNQMHKNYKKSKKYRDSRCRRRHDMFKLYEKHQEEQNYEKNKLLPVDKMPCLCLPHDHRRYSKKCKLCNQK